MWRKWALALTGAAIIGVTALAKDNTPPIRYGYWNVPTELIDHLRATVSSERLDHDFNAASFAELDSFIAFVPSYDVVVDVPFIEQTGLDPKEIAHTAPDQLLHIESVQYSGHEGFTHIVFVNWTLFKERDADCRNALLAEIIEKQDWAEETPGPLANLNCEDG